MTRMILAFVAAAAALTAGAPATAAPAPRRPMQAVAADPHKPRQRITFALTAGAPAERSAAVRSLWSGEGHAGGPATLDDGADTHVATLALRF